MGDVTTGEYSTVFNPKGIPMGTGSDDYARRDMQHVEWRQQVTVNKVQHFTFTRLGLLSIGEKLIFDKEAKRYEVTARESSEKTHHGPLQSTSDQI